MNDIERKGIQLDLKECAYKFVSTFYFVSFQ